MTVAERKATRYLQLSKDTFGTIGEIMLGNLLICERKAERKVAFRKLEQLIRLSGLLPTSSELVAISEGVDYLGTSILVLLYTENA